MQVKSKTYAINNSTVKVVFGDILTSGMDVIVSCDDCSMSMNGGLSRHILMGAGDTLLADTRKLAPARIGDAKMSTAGNLPYKYIFHAITIGQPEQPENGEEDIQAYIIGQSIMRCFQLLRANNLSSIAFPCVGAGTAGIPYDKVAKCMAKTISRYLMSTARPLEVEVYLLDKYSDMTDFDFLPFFEWFASYSHLAKKELEADISATSADENDYANVKIMEANVDSPADIFISYSRKDSSVAKAICAVLNEANVSYWINVDGIYSGENYKDSIVKAIKSSKIVLFLSSENSNKSSHVAKEIGIADKYNKVIIPVRLDMSAYNPKMDYDLSGIDAIDFTNTDDKSSRKLHAAIIAQIRMNNEK